MNIALVAYVPDKFILRGIKNEVQSNRQFDHTQIRSQMTPISCETDNEFLADFIGQPCQLLQSQPLDLRRAVHLLEVLAHTCSDSSGDNGFSFISPAAFLSNCWILISASASFSWQTRANPVPSSYFPRSASRGKSSDSIASTIVSSFFKASSNGRFSVFAGLFCPAFFEGLGTASDTRIKAR